MTTFNDLCLRVRQQILGYTRDQQQISMLTQDIGSADATFTVDTTTQQALSRGLVEIDSELILVKQIDASTGTLSVMGGALGRGREGSAAAFHSAGALITQSPLMPAVAIQNAITDTVSSMYPTLPTTGVTEIIKLAPVFEYALPAEAVGVHYVTMQTIGPSKIWHPGPRWRYNNNADPTDFPSGKSVQLMDDVVPGRAMRVVYLTEPGVMVSPSDQFTVTGYPETAHDCAVWGATARLVPAYEVARLQAQSIEGTERDSLVPPKAALAAADYFRGLYMEALDRERTRFFDATPNFAFWQGG